MQKYHDEPKQYKGYLKSALELAGFVNARLCSHLGHLSALLELVWIKRVDSLVTPPSLASLAR